MNILTVTLEQMLMPLFIGNISFSYPEEPFFMDVKMYDIPETIILAFRNLPKNCIGVSIRHNVGRKTRAEVNEYAKQTGLLVEWV